MGRTPSHDLAPPRTTCAWNPEALRVRRRDAGSDVLDSLSILVGEPEIGLDLCRVPWVGVVGGDELERGGEVLAVGTVGPDVVPSGGGDELVGQRPGR